jgi:sec-independent protein translocase protein TatA
MNFALLAMFGTAEIIVICVLVLILFGARKVPELMKGVGTGIKEFKKASRDVQDEFHRSMEEESRPAPQPRPASDTVAQGDKAPAAGTEPKV